MKIPNIFLSTSSISYNVNGRTSFSFSPSVFFRLLDLRNPTGLIFTVRSNSLYGSPLTARWNNCSTQFFNLVCSEPASWKPFFILMQMKWNYSCQIQYGVKVCAVGISNSPSPVFFFLLSSNKCKWGGKYTVQLSFSKYGAGSTQESYMKARSRGADSKSLTAVTCQEEWGSSAVFSLASTSLMSGQLSDNCFETKPVFLHNWINKRLQEPWPEPLCLTAACAAPPRTLLH